MSILFFHLDLGIGGAERLVLSLANATSEIGYDTSIITTRFDKSRCFSDCNKLKIRSYGEWIPRSIFGQFTAFLGILRLLYLILIIWISNNHYDIIINDQLAILNPILYLIGKRIIFYCHFPEPLMNPYFQKGHLIRRLYRSLLDNLDIMGMSFSDSIWVNSEFTLKQCEFIYPKIRKDKYSIIYPCVDKREENEEIHIPKDLETKSYFLSLNRYESKKNHQLAIQAFSIFSKNQSQVKLVIAGGYDDLIQDNKSSTLR